MPMEVKWLAGISLLFFAFTAYIGFIEPEDRNDKMNKLKGWTNNTFKWRWMLKRYIITKIFLGIGFGFAVWSLIIS